MTSSGTIEAPASTIMIASRVPETIRSMSERSRSLIGGIDDELAVDAADAHGADGAHERDRADRQRARSGKRAEDVGLVLLVRRKDRDHDLDVVLVALGEERPDRAVGQAAGQDGLLGRARLALDEAARDLAGGVHALFELDGEREEVQAGPRIGPVGGPEHHGVAEADGDGAACEHGQLAGLDGQGAAGELRLECLRHGCVFLLSQEDGCVPGTRLDEPERGCTVTRGLLPRAWAVALAAQSEPCDDGAIAGVVLLDQIGKKAPSLSDELEEAAAGLVVLRKASQVLRSSLILSVRSAICTSAEPVSPSLTAYSEITCSFVSRASGTRSSE